VYSIHTKLKEGYSIQTHIYMLITGFLWGISAIKAPAAWYYRSYLVLTRKSDCSECEEVARRTSISRSFSASMDTVRSRCFLTSSSSSASAVWCSPCSCNTCHTTHTLQHNGNQYSLKKTAANNTYQYIFILETIICYMYIEGRILLKIYKLVLLEF